MPRETTPRSSFTVPSLAARRPKEKVPNGRGLVRTSTKVASGPGGSSGPYSVVKMKAAAMGSLFRKLKRIGVPRVHPGILISAAMASRPVFSFNIRAVMRVLP